MKTSKQILVKEGIQNFKYELMFVKHKLDLIETLLSEIEAKAYSDEMSEYVDELHIEARVKMLMDEYRKLHSMVNPDKVHFKTEEPIPESL